VVIQAFIDKVYADNAAISTDTETIPYVYAELYKKGLG
jgi:hypothetical protein